MTEIGKVETIWLKRAHHGVMDPVAEARAVAGRGLVGNADQGGARQVTIIAREVWDALRTQLDARVDPSMRRANLLVSGVSLPNTRGRVLHVGAVRVRVRGETRPCERMDEALPGLRAALADDWNGGVFGELLDDGVIRIGDPIAWVPEGDPQP